MAEATTYITRVFPRAHAHALLGKSAAAFGIKIAAAILSFAMFALFARALPQDQFGMFGFAFSAATILALGASMGQRNLVLRFASIYIGQGDRSRAFAVIRHGYMRVITGAWLAATTLALAALLLPEQRAILTAIAVLTVALALGEFQPNPQRAAGRVALALVPRDIVFRVLMITIAGLSVMGVLPMFSAVEIAGLMAGALLLLTAGQACVEPFTHPIRVMTEPGTTDDASQWKRAGWGLWGNSVLNAAGRNLSIVFVGFFLTAEQTGALFAALRTAMVLELALMAVNVAAAPSLAQTLATGDANKTQDLCRFVTVLVTVPTVFAFVLFWGAGPFILALFGPEYAQAHWVLVVISAGYLIRALAGPTGQIMEMGGYERAYFRIMLVTTSAALLALFPLTLLLGMMGAALAIALNLAALHIWCLVFIKRQTGLSPGLINVKWVAK